MHRYVYAPLCARFNKDLSVYSYVSTCDHLQDWCGAELESVAKEAGTIQEGRTGKTRYLDPVCLQLVPFQLFVNHLWILCPFVQSRSPCLVFVYQLVGLFRGKAGRRQGTALRRNSNDTPKDCLPMRLHVCTLSRRMKALIIFQLVSFSFWCLTSAARVCCRKAVVLAAAQQKRRQQ